MRIGMMADTYKPYVSGITNYISLNKRYLEAAGHEVCVFTFGGLDYEDDEKNIIRSPGLEVGETGFHFNVHHNPEAKALIQSMDLVHVHHPFFSGLLALRYCRPHGIPIIFTNHSRYDLCAQAYLPLLPDTLTDPIIETLLEAYMPPFCEAVDMVISPAPSMEDFLRQLQVKSQIEVIPNGIEMQHFQEITPLARTDFGFADDDLLLIYTGRLSPEKNIDFLLQSFNKVAETLPNLQLLLLGDGPQRKKLVQEAKASPATERIHFMGMIPYEQLPGYLAMCDIFVITSLAEVHPLSVIEAMGASLPALGIHSPGMNDIITDGETGFLSENDLASFSVKLTKLCLDAPLREKIGANASERSQRYAIERTTASMLALYQKVIADAPIRKEEREPSLRKILERILS